MENSEWIWAAVAFGSGLLFGEIAGRLIRGAMARRGDGARDAAPAVGTFVFWGSTAVGLLVATAIIDSRVLEDLGSRLSDNVAHLLVAFLLLIGGYAASIAVAAMVGQSARKATGIRQVALERLLRIVIMAFAVVVALTELGVDSSVLVVLLAVTVGAPALTLALITAFGSRDVASQIAAGRALRHQLHAGQFIRCGDEMGTVVAMHPATVEIERSDGTRVLIAHSILLREPVSLGESTDR